MSPNFVYAPPWAPPGLPTPPGFWDELRTLHASPPRAYHTFDHIDRVLEHAAGVANPARGPGWRGPREVFAAIAFHDAIYVAGAADNEERSANLAREAIARWWLGAGIDADRVAALILLTARHGRLVPEDVAGDEDAALFLDCDMAIVAASPPEFAAYDEAVAAEWRPLIGAEAWAQGRHAFLSGLLAKPRIFLSDHFHRRLDAAARANLGAAVARSAPQSSAGGIQSAY
jgi:predicted metal-dependent HD superfamily phosphohydrolase